LIACPVGGKRNSFFKLPGHPKLKDTGGMLTRREMVHSFYTIIRQVK